MHRVVLLLACAYAVSSTGDVHEPFPPFVNPVLRTVLDNTPEATQLQTLPVPLDIHDPNFHRISIFNKQKIWPGPLPDNTYPPPIAQDFHKKDSFAKDPYATDPYAKGPYAKDSFAKDSNREDPYTKDPYINDPYTSDSYGKNSYVKNPYPNDPYAYDTYAKDFYAKYPHSSDSYGLDSFYKKSYASDPYAKDPYATGPYAKNPYSKDPYAIRPYTKNRYSKGPNAIGPYEQDPFTKDHSIYYPSAKDVYSYDPYVQNIYRQHEAFPLIYDNPIDLQNPPIPWNPPNYVESLKDVEESITRQRSHFTPDAINDKDDRNFRYIILIHVVNNLAKDVATNGWSNYNSSYGHLVRNAVDQGLVDPQTVVTLSNCEWFEPVLKHTKRIKQIIDQPAVQFVCKAQPASCDAVIWTTVQLNHTSELLESATALGLAAEAARTFLGYYAGAFEAISAQNVYKYLFLAEDELRPLVASYAVLHKYLIDRGDGHCLL